MVDTESLSQEVLDELNLCRANPSKYADHVAAILKLYRGNEIHRPGEIPIVTEEGPAAVQECIKRLRSMKPIPILEFSEGISKACQDHCDDLGPKGETGHDGTDGSTMEDRIERYGDWDVTVGENIDFGNDVARDIVVSLLIDDGIEERGHRENILNPQFRVAGVAVGPHREFKYMCTIDFAGGFAEKQSQKSGQKTQPKTQPKTQAGTQPANQAKSQQAPSKSASSTQTPSPALLNDILKEINLMRSNPKKYADFLTENLKYFKGKELHKPGQEPLITEEGPAAVQECIKVMKSTNPLPNMVLNNGMNKAAQDHCNDLGPKGERGHDGTDGSTLDDRLNRYGEWDVTIGEVIDFGNSNPRDIMFSLLCDDGVSDRGHRTNLLKPEFTTAGIGFGPHTVFDLICTIDLAGGFTESEESKETPIQYQPANKNQNANQPASKNQGSNQPQPATKNQTPVQAKNPPASKQTGPDPALVDDVFNELNLVRSNPKKYADYVAEVLRLFKGKEIHKPGQIPIVTEEGPAAVQECIKRLKSLNPLPPFEFSDGLSKASQDHCDDIGPKGITGHDGSDGSNSESRTERYGEWDITIGENIDFGNNNGRDIVISLLIDDGVSNRGHRENILKPQFKVVGIGCGPHQEYEHMCTINFAGGFNESSNKSAPAQRAGNSKSPIASKPESKAQDPNTQANPQNRSQAPNSKTPNTQTPNSQTPNTQNKNQAKQPVSKSQNKNSQPKAPELINLSEKDLAETREVFDSFDNGSGLANTTEIAKIRKFFENENDHYVFKLLEGIEDIGENITYEQLLEHIDERLGNRLSREGVQRIFDLVDYDGSGLINLEKLQKIAKDVGEDLDQGDLQEALAKISSEKGGMNIDDFYLVMTKKVYG